MEPWFDENEINAMSEYLKSGSWLTEFMKTREFEQAIEKYTGSRHCIAVNNGTVSLSMALMVSGVKPGDEVIVPDWTMIATPNSAVMIGAEPVFVDIEENLLCMDPAKVEQVITKKTKALIYVSMNGRCGDIEKIKKICDKHDLSLIEDAAQSLGSFHKGKHIGAIGDIGSFSFSPPKIITTGQGGALATDDDKLADSIRKLKDFGRASGGNDIHDTIGYNFKFTDMQAVIGIEQMKKLGWRVKRKKEIYGIYEKELSGIEEIKFIGTDLKDTCPWFIDIYAENPDGLLKSLKSGGIGSRKVYPAIHTQKAYSHLNAESFPVSEKCASAGLWLPSSSRLSDEEVIQVCSCIRKFYKKSY